MTFTPRRRRLAAAVLLASVSFAAVAQTAPAGPVADPPAQPSALTAELFYEVLVGELTARSDTPADGYALMLDAARRTRDGRLFQRAVEIALQARSGDAALAASRAWKQTLPDAREPRRFELQILIALNRIGETAEPLRAELAATPVIEHPLLMAVIARNYTRATDKKLAASVVELALVDDLKNPATGALAWTTVGRLRLTAGDTAGALDAALKGQAVDAASDGPPVLALDMIDPAQPQAEAIVQRYLANPKALPELRMGYARVLIEGRRYAQAEAELNKLTTSQPELPEPWLMLGVLRGQTKQDSAAEAAVKRYIELAGAQGDADERKRGLTQAYLLMSQLAERRKDFPAAERWLARIDGADDLVATQMRRASLLARQGKLPQARQLVRELPQKTPEEARQKLMAEVQLLRDAKQYQSAYDLLVQAAGAAPNDSDLIYDQAMVAEKLVRFDEMERLLRRLIELKPDNQNAYNALGYSLADRRVRLDEARTLIRKAVELAPEDPFIADSLGWVEFRLGNSTEATRILENAYKKRPDPEIGAHFGEVLWASGQRERALAIWKEAMLADAENETLQETLKRLRVRP